MIIESTGILALICLVIALRITFKWWINKGSLKYSIISQIVFGIIGTIISAVMFVLSTYVAMKDFNNFYIAILFFFIFGFFIAFFSNIVLYIIFPSGYNSLRK